MVSAVDTATGASALQHFFIAAANTITIIVSAIFRGLGYAFNAIGYAVWKLCGIVSKLAIANPIVTAIIAIAFTCFAVYYNWNSIRDLAHDLWGCKFKAVLYDLGSICTFGLTKKFFSHP